MKENEKNSVDEEEENKEEIENKEIIIVNMDDISKSEEEEEKEKEEKEEKEEIIDEYKKEEDFKKNTKYLKTKPKPLINVDPNSIQFINYKVENKPKTNNYNLDNYNIEDIMNRYSNNNIIENKYEDKYKTYQIYDTPSINEIRNKYQIKNIKQNFLQNDSQNSNSYRYIPGTYRNKPSYNLNNNYNENNNKNNNNENNDNSIYLNKYRKQNTYYNYGPIYNYERKKDIKNQILSANNEENSNDIKYKVSNPYSSPTRRTYYMSPKDKYVVPGKIINTTNDNTYNANKSNIRRNYPNLYYFNSNENSIINKTYNNNPNEPINKSRNNKIQIDTRKVYSVERPNRVRNSQQIRQIRRTTLNPEQKDNYLDSSINNRNEKRNLSYNKNNSMFEINKNKDNNLINNEYNNSYSNSFLIRKLNNGNNQQTYSYVINDIDNLYQYYPSYNQSNGFSGNSTFSKLNYIYN